MQYLFLFFERDGAAVHAEQERIALRRIIKTVVLSQIRVKNDQLRLIGKVSALDSLALAAVFQMQRRGISRKAQ